MTQTTLDQLNGLVAEGRLRSALETLNLLSGCRFTAFFRFSDADLRNLVLIDRQDPYAPTMQAAPIDQTYCVFVQQSRDAFLVTDASGDLRLEGHPKRPVVRTYVGFPVASGDAVFGTVCHFDYDVVDVAPDVVALTRSFAASFEPHGALAGLQRLLDRRLESLRLMSHEILLASTSRGEALEAFEEYAQPLRQEADRLLDRGAAAAFHADVDALATRFLSLAETAVVPPLVLPLTGNAADLQPAV
ncbi:GAF domain-containing protein [Luteimonas fraxinea]|uniref:GAF domain-containing protein n=1 Tax=Luteimonas fraxinea TaxID=2901869 RepID=A0ABS8UA93_9GAMM|nr:GAF domain-containing protein [Luteimonas fraxinea]MCD9095674.1 GAF domain-containing protein [Luteimonas fraxinea]MCD9124256.1 GAF domain-containing protein [Luteimonas fraxinea]UHH11134.1 GAF domain-containing protein [Luteimonas fraxinea]